MRRPGPAAISLLLLTLPSAGCEPGSEGRRGKDPAEPGAVLLAVHGCGGCHVIPGVTGADGTLGPPLDGFGNRAFIAGKLPNEGEVREAGAGEVVPWARVIHRTVRRRSGGHPS